MTERRKNLISARKAAQTRTAGAGYARALLEFAVSRGAARDLLLARTELAECDLADTDDRVPFRKFVTLMRSAIELTRNPALALHFGELGNLTEYSIVGLIAESSKTMGHALVQLNRYGRLVVEVEVDIGAKDRFEIVADNGEPWLVDTRMNPNDFPELTESTFARMVSHTRQFGLPDKHFVKALEVTHARPAYHADYDRIFKAPVAFNATRNAMLIDMSWTTHKVARQASRYAFGVLSEHAKALLASLENAKTTRGQVEALLIPILHTGNASSERTAEKLGMSRDTLYRRLKEEGTSYDKLLDELRHKMALHYLDGRKVSVNETAYLVGFSDPSAFSRAFRRWTGTSPKKRKQD
jgi:AraC-like DNA-binding protein